MFSRHFIYVHRVRPWYVKPPGYRPPLSLVRLTRHVKNTMAPHLSSCNIEVSSLLYKLDSADKDTAHDVVRITYLEIRSLVVTLLFPHIIVTSSSLVPLIVLRQIMSLAKNCDALCSLDIPSSSQHSRYPHLSANDPTLTNMGSRTNK